MKPINDKPWSPYLAGGLTGLALALAQLFSDAMFGATPAYAYIGNAVQLLLHNQSLASVDAYGRYLLAPTWHLTFVLGITLGALLAALLYREFKWQAVPPLWREFFGSSKAKRALWAFLGGVVSMIGVRQAMGCPSGLGLSGMIQLSVSGFLGFAMFFLGGIIMAGLLYRRRGAAPGGSVGGEQ